MQAGTHNAENKLNVVLRAPQDLAFSLDIKRQRAQQGAGKGYRAIGCIEQIIFEVDRDCTYDTSEARRVGRRLYWPERCPMIARTIPEEDLIFTQPLILPLPEIPDPCDPVNDPYLTDQHGVEHSPDGKPVRQSRMIKQELERIASAKFRNFLVFQPVAQIIILMIQRGAMRFASFGDARMPLSSLPGWDGRKMALLIDPRTGDAYFSGGRYDFSMKG